MTNEEYRALKPGDWVYRGTCDISPARVYVTRYKVRAKYTQNGYKQIHTTHFMWIPEEVHLTREEAKSFAEERMYGFIDERIRGLTARIALDQARLDKLVNDLVKYERRTKK